MNATELNEYYVEMAEILKVNEATLRKYVKRLVNNARGRAKDPQKTQGNTEFKLTEEWVLDQLVATHGMCPYTDVAFDFGLGKSWHGRAGAPARPSINRLNPMQGYTPENCELVANWYNAMMGPYTHREIRDFVPGLYENLAATGKMGWRHKLVSSLMGWLL